MEPPNGRSADGGQTGVCLVLELKDDSSRGEEPCGRPAHPEHRGYCQSHYKERLVELIHRCHGDPAVLFSLTEMRAELQRWHVAAPSRKPDEAEQLYARRLLQTLTNSVPLRRQLLPAQTQPQAPPPAPCYAPWSSAPPPAQGLTDSAQS